MTVPIGQLVMTAIFLHENSKTAANAVATSSSAMARD
jgi:hypothetical protein